MGTWESEGIRSFIDGAGKDKHRPSLELEIGTDSDVGDVSILHILDKLRLSEKWHTSHCDRHRFFGARAKGRGDSMTPLLLSKANVLSVLFSFYVHMTTVIVFYICLYSCIHSKYKPPIRDVAFKEGYNVGTP